MAGRWPHDSLPELSPDCLAPQTPLPRPLAPFVLPPTSVPFVQLWASSGPSLSVEPAWPASPPSGVLILSHTVALAWAGRSTAHSCFLQESCSQGHCRASSCRWYPGGRECSSLLGSRLQLHLLAQLLANDPPRCPRGTVFQNPILQIQENHFTFQTQSLSYSFLLPSGGLSKQDL